MKNRKASQNRRKKQDQHSKSGSKSSPKIKADLFGQHAVAAAWVNPKRHIHNLFITENALNQFEDALQKAHKMGLKRPSPQIIDKSALDHSLPPGTVHQGIALSCQSLEEPAIQDLMIAAEQAGHQTLVMLDQVTDPHNIGAILRSACAFGTGGLIMQKKHAPELKGVLAKIACGGVEHTPVLYETNLTRTLETLQENGYFAIGLDERGEQDIGDLPTYEKCVIVLGAEGDGLRRLVREQCDILTRLPTDGAFASLNVSNAAAVALYALRS